ncbi:MAG: hypothetical protein WBE73_19095 [Candidatus Acidiferrum sp.]
MGCIAGRGMRAPGVGEIAARAGAAIGFEVKFEEEASELFVVLTARVAAGRAADMERGAGADGSGSGDTSEEESVFSTAGVFSDATPVAGGTAVAGDKSFRAGAWFATGGCEGFESEDRVDVSDGSDGTVDSVRILCR